MKENFPFSGGIDANGQVLLTLRGSVWVKCEEIIKMVMKKVHHVIVLCIIHLNKFAIELKINGSS